MKQHANLFFKQKKLKPATIIIMLNFIYVQNYYYISTKEQQKSNLNAQPVATNDVKLIKLQQKYKLKCKK